MNSNCPIISVKAAYIPYTTFYQQLLGLIYSEGLGKLTTSGLTVVSDGNRINTGFKSAQILSSLTYRQSILKPGITVVARSITDCQVYNSIVCTWTTLISNRIGAA